MHDPFEALERFDDQMPSRFQTRSLYNGNTIQYYDRKDFQHQLLLKFQEIFSVELLQQDEELNTKPWCLTNFNDNHVPDGNFDMFCKVLEKWCLNMPYSLLISNYSIVDHFRKFGYKDLKVLNQELHINAVEESKHRVIMADARNGIVLNLRFVEGTTENDVMVGIKNAQTDCKYLGAMYGNIMRTNNYALVGVLVLHDLYREDLKKLNSCRTCMAELVFTADDITSEKAFNDRYLDIKKEVKNIKPPDVKIWEKTPEKIRFLPLAASIWGYMQTEEVFLPGFVGNMTPHRIYLSRQQRKFLHLQDKHVILKGAFGSGKSIVAQIKMQQMVRSLQGDRKIYYLCWDAQSIFDKVMKRNFQLKLEEGVLPQGTFEVTNLEQYTERYNLKEPATISDILKDVKKRHMNAMGEIDADLIVDEFDSSSLSEYEGTQIEITARDMKSSNILIVPQTLECHRSRKTTKGFLNLLTEKKTYDYFKYENTGFKMFTLKKVMRNTSRINALSKIAVEILEKQGSTVYRDPSSGTVTKLTTLSGEGKQLKTNNLTASSATISKITEVSRNEKHLKTNYSTVAESSSPSIVKIIQEDVEPVEESKEMYKSPEKEEKNLEKKKRLLTTNMIDHLFKRSSTLAGTGRSFIKSTFKFSGIWECGLGISGEVPILLYPFEELILSEENINSSKLLIQQRLEYALKIITDGKDDGLCVICFDVLTCLLFKQVFNSMGKVVLTYTPTMVLEENDTNVENFFKNQVNKVFLTDHVGCRGTEFERVVVAISKYEYYLQQYLIEAMTRATNYLSVMVISTAESCNKSRDAPCNDMFERWIENQLVNVYNIGVCSSDDQDHIDECQVCGTEYHPMLHTGTSELRGDKYINNVTYDEEAKRFNLSCLNE